MGASSDRDLRRRHTARRVFSRRSRARLSSGSTRRNAKTREGSKFLRRALVEAAHAAARTKGSYFAARSRNLAVRSGKPRAAVAIGHTILVSAYHMLDRQENYHEIDPSVAMERRRARLEKCAIEQLKAMGYEVTLRKSEPAA